MGEKDHNVAELEQELNRGHGLQCCCMQGRAIAGDSLQPHEVESFERGFTWDLELCGVYIL